MIQQKPSTYDMWTASARNAYDQMERRALKAEAKLAQLENSFTEEINYMTPTEDTLSWNLVMMRTLNDMLNEAAETFDYSKLFDKVMKTIGSYLDATRVIICDWNALEKTITIVADHITDKAPDTSEPFAIGTYRKLDTSFEEQLTSPTGYWVYHHDEDDLSSEKLLKYETHGIKTALYASMVTNDGEVVGFVEVWDTIGKRDYTPQQIIFLVSVAQQMATGVRTAQLRRSLIESERRYRLLMDTMQGGVVYVDTNRTIQFVNQHFASMMSLSIEDLIHQNLTELGIKHTTSTDIENEFKLSNAQGEVRYLQVTKAPVITDSQQQLGEVLVYTDITKRKEAERIAVDLALEQERTALLGQFIQDASHEFYTPLSIINTKVHLLKNYQTDERSMGSLTAIQNQSQIISDLVKALVQISNLHSVHNLSVRLHNLILLLEQVLASFEDIALENQQTLTFEVTNPKIMLLCDAHYLILALNNIIHNALRYTPQNGTIVIQVKEHAESVSITIEDNGLGMTSEEQAQMFNRFYRADTAHSTSGFGLGLAIVKQIVELHNGHIHVDSAIGQGTTVTLMLPKPKSPS